MLNFIQQLKGSYSSKVELMQDEVGKLWVLKTVPEDEIAEIENEKYFLTALKNNSLNSIEFKDSPSGKPNQILLEYVENSTTVGDSNNSRIFKCFGEQMLKMHAIKFDDCFKLIAIGRIKINWEDFILSELAYGLNRISDKNLDFSKSELSRINQKIIDLSKKISIHLYLCFIAIHTQITHFILKITKKFICSIKVLLFCRAMLFTTLL